ncbi:hypothetical protein ATSB10_31620 [Dyella thiooxydans]|uniref:Abortive phage infection protein n=1 Tax=Dyella thiooxydans TaxID=445710 RepID=A0A160N3P9_9GAMM|nr:MZA anti-phage system associated AIPR family protein MzaE [Dyella thiooxydans]AND70616.1 hypothetical protein ATSB10_31620 [Dyella thiooxydans]
MDLKDFLAQTRADVQAEIADRLSSAASPYPYDESVFAEIVMAHMAEIGMTFEPQVCHYTAKAGSANVKISGYAVSEDGDQLDLFVCLYHGKDTVQSIPDSEAKTAAEQCLRFLAKCAEGKLASAIDPSSEVYELAVTIQKTYTKLDQIRVYVLTDAVAKSKNFKAREIQGKTVKLEVMDIERLHRHWSEGKPRDELVVNFIDVSGSAIPCVYVPGEADYDYALTAIPGETLRFIYEKFGARLLEANVRSFLSASGKVNRGIRDTLRTAPDRFMAYNNGIVIVADEANLARTQDGSHGLAWLKGMQIVNGGQTTASIYFTAKKHAGIDLAKVRVPAKVIILKSDNAATEETLIADISRYANSQNAVRQSDLSANTPFHIEIEKLATTTYCPDGVGRWFYERAAGSYATTLAREGATPARYRQLKTVVIPPSRRITKTDLAKYLNTWAGKPHVVSLGAQKNFTEFTDDLKEKEQQGELLMPDVRAFKQMVAKAIIYRRVQSLVRPMFPAFQGNVATYLISVLAHRHGSEIDLDRIWLQQDISEPLKDALRALAVQVNAVLHQSANGRMVSEWAKKPECWDTVRAAAYSALPTAVPERRSQTPVLQTEH